MSPERSAEPRPGLWARCFGRCFASRIARCLARCFGRIRAWFARGRLEGRARRILDTAFLSPEVLRGTSLGARHRARWILLEIEESDGRIRRIRFGILRHPRPYAFSRQSHKVIEEWSYDVEHGRMERLGGYNLTRAEGLDDGG